MCFKNPKGSLFLALLPTCKRGLPAVVTSHKPTMQSTLRTLRSRVRSLGASAADGKNIVAFSGGVDSSLVAALVHEAYPSSSQACVGVSSALPAAQLHLARTVANHIGKCVGVRRCCSFSCEVAAVPRLSRAVEYVVNLQVRHRLPLTLCAQGVLAAVYGTTTRVRLCVPCHALV